MLAHPVSLLHTDLCRWTCVSYRTWLSFLSLRTGRITDRESFRNNQEKILSNPNHTSKGDKRYWTSENVPVPTGNGGRNKTWPELPFDTIDVGTVIGIPLTPEEKTQKAIRSLRSLVWRRGKDLDKKYSTRVTDYGIGIWRIE